MRSTIRPHFNVMPAHEPTAELTRRWFLGAGLIGSAAWLVGCKSSQTLAGADAGATPTPSTGTREAHTASNTRWGTPAPAPTLTPATGAAPSVCVPTEENIEGPYYKPGAPRTSTLVTERTPGTRLHLEGSVLSAECVPVVGAVMEVWHADHRGAYDNNGFGLRGVLMTDAAGRFQLETIVPGHYLNGRQYRPAHVHVKIHAPGHRSLTTQLYFEGDPHNAVDLFIRRSLVMRLEQAARGVAARYDFILPAA